MMRSVRISLAVLAAVLAVASSQTAAARDAPPKLANHSGIRVVETKRLNERLLDVTVATPALAVPEHVRILLPAGYARSSRRYPVLYLLHGGLDDYRSWTDKGAAEKITARSPLIVVMPEAGDGGWYADWDNHGAGGPPMWETFHIRQLVPWVDFNLRTLAAREGRALAGLSMGGLGTMTYASRHPDMFVSAASFSGAVDTNYPPVQALIEVSGLPDQSVYGPRVTNEVNWRGHNPWDLAGNLRGMTLGLYGGNGRPREGQSGLPLDPIEYGTYEMGLSLHKRLWNLDIAHRWVEGLGQHQWEDWQRYLRSWLPTMKSAFARPPARPERFAFTAVEPEFEIFGWRVRMERAALEFATLSATRGEFSVTGSGTATVVPPSRFRPGSVHRVWVAPENAGCVARSVRANSAGRLAVEIPLGPANPDQQFSAASQARGGRMFGTTAYMGSRGPLCR